MARLASLFRGEDVRTVDRPRGASYCLSINKVVVRWRSRRAERVAERVDRAFVIGCHRLPMVPPDERVHDADKVRVDVVIILPMACLVTVSARAIGSSG